MRWEAHTCLPLHPDASFVPLDRFHAVGVNYVSINVGMDLNPVGQIMSVIAGFRQRLDAASDRYELVSSVAEIEAAGAAGRLAIGFDLEGSMPLLERPEMVALYRDLGVRQIHFAYNRNNSVADGCHDVERGLTPLGRRMVEAVNEAGLLMDCSHTGRRCSLEIMEASSAPVIFSHANPLALVEHGRNVTDDQIRACAATGGVVCVSGVSAFLGTQQPNAADVARHAAYVADLVGIEHVGIGLDIGFSEVGLDDDPPGGFDPDYWWPKSAGYARGIRPMAYAPVETWGELPNTLGRAGMTEQEVALVLGGNMARVAREVWGG
ncbi:MAG TPA: membrane dipeptidase [Steroidobacteraceae bacterium]|nr:membrane dipeptidase [Steroidobacteraceae bacterium]